MLAIVIVALTILLYTIQTKIYEKYWGKNLSVSIRFSKEAVRTNETVELMEVIENGKYLPLPMLTVKFETDKCLHALDEKNSAVTDLYYRNDIFAMKPMRKTTRTIPFLCTKRGYFRIHDITLVSADLFLQNERIGGRSSDASLYVYPRVLTNEDHSRLLSRMTGEVLAKRHQEEDPFEFRGIREYSMTDELRTINWKATARTGELKVNMKNYTSLKAVRLFLNLEDTGIRKHSEADEYAISMVATLAELFLQNGMRVLLETNGVDILSKTRVNVNESGGVLQLNHIMQSLARIDDVGKAYPFVECLGQKICDFQKGVYTILVTTEIREELFKTIQQMMDTKSEFKVFHVREKEMDKLKEAEELADYFVDILVEET